MTKTGTYLPTYIGFCCREWIMALGHTPGRCGLCEERPTYLRADEPVSVDSAS